MTRTIIGVFHQLLQEHITFHNSLSGLHKHVDKDILPEELGGDPSELAAAHGYQSALGELRRGRPAQQNQQGQQQQEEEGEEQPADGKGRGRGRGRGWGE